MTALIHPLSAWGTGVAASRKLTSSPADGGAANAGEGAHLIAPSPATIILLKALAAHDGVSVDQFVDKLARDRRLGALARAICEFNSERAI